MNELVGKMQAIEAEVAQERGGVLGYLRIVEWDIEWMEQSAAAIDAALE